MTPTTTAPTTPTPCRGWRALLAPYVPWLLFAVSTTIAGWLGLRPPPAPAAAPQPVPVLPAAAELSTPVEYEGARYEGGGESHAAHAEANGRPWPVRRITYWVDYVAARQIRPALSDEQVRAAFWQAWSWWAEGLTIDPAEVVRPDEALVRIGFARIDGGLGILAWSDLADGTLRPKQQQYDTAERWTAGPPAPGLLSLPAVAAHEIGHVLALGHDDADAAALMRPSYTALIPRPQPRDFSRLVALGYQPRASPAPADLISFPVRASAQDLKDALRKAGHKIE